MFRERTYFSLLRISNSLTCRECRAECWERGEGRCKNFDEHKFLTSAPVQREKCWARREVPLAKTQG